MGVLQIKKQSKKYDAVIIGSGAGGGMAAYVLANAGLKVCLLEAGPDYDPAIHSSQLKFPYESPRRGASTKFRPFGDFDGAFWGWQIDGEPYTTKDNTKWEWWRSRMVGGRTNHWGRISLRFGPDDFRRKSIDGLGENWPITYDDIKPFYDKVDKLIGVFGTNEGLPNDPDGHFLPPPKPRLHEMFIKKAAAQSQIPVIPSRLSILTKKINEERGQCFYCAQCGRSCKVYADFSSSSCLVQPAVKTGNVDLIVNAMAREVLTNNEGLATGVSYVDKTDLQEYQVYGRTVVVAASTCESARLLLNSKSPRHPNGLANSSNAVGKYLHDSTGAGMAGFVPALFNRKRYNEDGVGGMHVYTPWWLDNKKLDFPRGYHIEYGGGMGMPMYGFSWGIDRMNGDYAVNGKKKEAGGYGASLKEDVRFFYGAEIGMAGRGEAVPNIDNYCEIDPEVVDQYGIPVLRFNVKHSDYEIKQAKHMKETFREIFHNMGAVITYGDNDDESNMYGLHAPGNIIHEAGTVRMGADAKTSPLNKWGQAYECKNLFVADGSVFTSQADKNITWTILALSMRTSEHIVDELKKIIFKIITMDRRDSIKAMFVGTVSAGILLEACETADKKATPAAGTAEAGDANADRMKEEIAYNEKLREQTFFNEHEMATIAVLSDIIIPKDEKSGSATDAKVPDFIEFIVKDMPSHQTPMRGGLKWLDMHCMTLHGDTFIKLDDTKKMQVVDSIAYPRKAKKELSQGVNFFNLMRNLTVTGFYTSKIGIADLEYMGNRPNQWNGVPDDVLKQYNMAYTEKELKECVSYS